MVLPVIIFFILAVLLGTVLVYSAKIEIFLEEKLAWGLVLGAVLLTIFIFLFSLLFGFTRQTIFISIFIFAIGVGLIFFVSRDYLIKKIAFDIGLFKKRLKEGKLALFLILLIVALVFFANLWPKVFYEKNGEIFTIGAAGVWADWAAHSSYAFHFLYSDKISLTHPLFWGTKFSYTFAADFLSAVLMKIGAGFIPATILPGFFFSLALVIVLYYLAFRLIKKESAAFLTLFLYFFGGGLGFAYFFLKIKETPSFNFLNFLRTFPWEFTNLTDKNIHWTAFINTLLLPQRSLAMGLPLGIIALTCLLLALENKKRTCLFFVSGLFVSFLPVIHIHSFAAVSIVAFFLIILLSPRNAKTIFRRLLAFYLPVFIIGIPQILLLFPIGKASPKINLGWFSQKENWLLFWFRNIGLFLVMIPFAFLKLDKRLKIIYLSFFTLFIAGNIFIFQPYEYDNIKIFTYWFFATSAVVALFLTKLWEKNLFGKIITGLIIPFLIFSSFLDLLHLYFYPGIKFSNKEDIKAAQFVRENTPSNSIFLTSDRHNHFVPVLTGRQILMGYRGWLWTYGINYGQREMEISKMFSGGKEAKKLLEKYKVDYAVIGPSEKYDFKANESFYSENYPLIFLYQNIKIYKISE